MSSESSDSEPDCGYDVCSRRSNSCALPFDPNNIERIILSICDRFDFRVILSDNRTKGALLVTAGLSFAGGLVGRHYGGKVGAAVGGAIGGACGLGLVAVTMHDMWQEIKPKLHELFDLVYDFLAGMGIEDYKRAALLLTGPSSATTQLALLILEATSSSLGKKVVSSLTQA